MSMRFRIKFSGARLYKLKRPFRCGREALLLREGDEESGTISAINNRLTLDMTPRCREMKSKN
jgi:hypothetical protein